MRPLPNEDAEQFARRMTEIAWSNGAFCRRRDIDRLRAELAAAKAQLVSNADELAAMQKQRDEARIRVCELCARIGGVYRRVNREVVECRTPEEIAEVCDWDCFAEKERGGA